MHYTDLVFRRLSFTKWSIEHMNADFISIAFANKISFIFPTNYLRSFARKLSLAKHSCRRTFSIICVFSSHNIFTS